MGREFELKFGATPEQQETILKDLGAFSSLSMETTYFDTPDGSLSQRQITLRRRLENGVSVCTVKTPEANGARGEWELQWQDITTAVPELCKLGCPEEVLTLTKPGLTEVCGARFTRLYKPLSVEGTVVELALDRGVLLGGGREIPLREVEVELKTGSEEAAAAFAQSLAKKYGLRPEKKSKFRRALALAKEEI